MKALIISVLLFLSSAAHATDFEHFGTGYIAGALSQGFYQVFGLPKPVARGFGFAAASLIAITGEMMDAKPEPRRIVAGEAGVLTWLGMSLVFDF